MDRGGRTDDERARSFGWWLLCYVGVLIPGFLVLAVIDTGALCELLARATHAILVLAGGAVRHEGAFVRSDAFSMQVVSACDATDVCLLLGAAILVTAAPWPRRLVGLVLAVVLTQVANVGRLVALFLVGATFPEHFEAAHQIFWQAVMMIWAVSFYVRWL